MRKATKFLTLLLAVCIMCGVFASCDGGGIEIEFNLNYIGAPEAGAPAPKTVRVGGAYGKLPEPARQGFIFDGWYPDKELEGNEITASTTVEKLDSHPLFAKWKGTPITISYDLQGGKMLGEPTMPDRNTATGLRYSLAVMKAPDPRYKYVFTGWYLTPEADGEKLDSSTIITMPGNHTLYAGWRSTPSLYDFENDRDILDFSFAGQMNVVDFDGSRQLRLRNPGSGNYREDMYLEFGGQVPAGAVVTFDFTLQGTNPEGYETGVWAMPSSNKQFNGSIQQGMRGRWYDGYKQTFTFAPGVGMSGIALMLEFSRYSPDWQNMSHPEYWQAITIYIDNIRLILPTPAPAVKDYYDFEGEYGSEEEFDGNLAVEGGTIQIADNPAGGKRLEIKNPSGENNPVLVYLKRPTQAGAQVTFGINFAGTPAVSATNRVSVYYYAANASGARIGTEFGTQYTSWSLINMRELTFTAPACDRICVKLEFGDGNTTQTEIQSRIFYISYIEFE